MKRLSLLELLLYWHKDPKYWIVLIRVGLIEDCEGHESSFLEFGVYEEQWTFDFLWFSFVSRALERWRDNQ